MKITPNTTLTARSIGDSQCILSIVIISRTEKRATFRQEGKVRTSKIYTDESGNEYLRPDSYSMSPVFRAR